MKYTTLGSAGIKVSEVCLGTMTWGIQNTQADADAQLAYALEQGVNFIDTAEMYPVPPNSDTYGDTERIIGNWLGRNASKREDIVLASKIAGAGFGYIRGGSKLSGDTLPLALDDSLARLNTDYIDLYQLHWPNRATPHFGKHWPSDLTHTQFDVEAERDDMRNIVIAIGQAIDAGKIKNWGLSDDTCWGIHTYLNICKELNVPPPVSIQNEFSLVHAKDSPYLIESCVYENIAYLPWSPLATGLLTGKYRHGARPEGSRWTLVHRHGLFRDTTESQAAVLAYCEIAERYGLSPTTMALAWCKQVDGVSSTIIGATSLPQLQENIQAFNIELSEDCLQDIRDVLKQFPMPF
ncbi:aldo/keto reductase [Agaribacter flavus]|uniref:Aldo/keto reductase n=1 Tax=Agaribacter flavus TaxID=1902781 RepID=A0ABV7FL20_9ALTE